MTKMGKKIKQPKANATVSANKVLEVDYPIFCFKHFQYKSLAPCSENQVKQFFERLTRLANLGWKEIQKSGRHDYGWEFMPTKNIKCALPPIVTPDVEKVYVFRYNNNNNPFIALRQGNIIHILLIEANFGDIYDHN